MSFQLHDECVAKCCVRGGTVYTSVRSVEVPSLGRGASDLDIYKYVRANKCVLVTLNGQDYATLAATRGPISAIVLPMVPPRGQQAFLRWVTPLARRIFEISEGRFVEVGLDGRAISYRVQRGFSWRDRPSTVGGAVQSSAIH